MPMLGYRIDAIPTTVAYGNTYAGRAICDGNAVVGSSDVAYNQPHAVVYDGTNLTVLGTLPGGSFSYGADGNAAGTVVGESSTGSFGRAFVYRGGAISELPGIGGQYSSAAAVNDGDMIVGQATIPGSGDVNSHAILWEPGCAYPIDLTAQNGGDYGFARDINNAGDIVGTDVLTAVNQTRAVVWRNQVQVVLDAGGAPSSQAYGISNSGLIAGQIMFSPGHADAVVWRNDVMTDLGTLGGTYAWAAAVNDQGDVVGASSNLVNDRDDAFLYTNGNMVDLNNYVDQTHWELLAATDICDDGRIVGTAMLDGHERAFILTPTP